MEKIIKKRTDLMNFFLNEDGESSKREILQKEFAVLSFSPREEYIDLVKTDYDDLCVDLSTFLFEDTPECYIKGIIVDVDRQKYQTIIHIINKDNNVGIVIRPEVLEYYEKYLITGDPIIAKCKIWNERLYMSFLVSIDHMEDFKQELAYMSGIAQSNVTSKIKQLGDDRDISYGVVVECAFVKTKTGKDMLRGTIWDGKQQRSFGCMANSYHPIIPKKIKAGDYIKFDRPIKEFFINNVEVTRL